MSDDSMGWAPDVCTLPTVQQPMRVAEFDQLFAEAVRGSERIASTHLRLTLAGPPGLRARVEDLAARENECCSFFEFDVRPARRSDRSMQKRAAVKLTQIETKIADLQVIATSLRAALDAGCDDLATCATTDCCPLSWEDCGCGFFPVS